MISVTYIVTSSAPLGVDMTYLVTRAISGPHDVDKTVHAFSMFGGLVGFARHKSRYVSSVLKLLC